MPSIKYLLIAQKSQNIFKIVSCKKNVIIQIWRKYHLPTLI